MRRLVQLRIYSAELLEPSDAWELENEEIDCLLGRGRTASGETEVLQEIGRGAFGCVYSTVFKGNEVAIKVVKG